jgi:hypothetical protein
VKGVGKETDFIVISYVFTLVFLSAIWKPGHPHLVSAATAMTSWQNKRLTSLPDSRQSVSPEALPDKDCAAARKRRQ